MGKLNINFSDSNQLQDLIKNEEKYPKYLLGENENGENTQTSINKDGITLSTMQNNGFIRLNYFDQNGYPSGETFNGRWK